MKRFSAKWTTTTLGEHVDIQTGFPFKSQSYTDDADGIRLLRGDNIVQGALRWEGVTKWSSAERHEYPKYELRADDVVLAMDRPWIEAGLKYAWISEHDLPCLLVQRVSRLRGSRSLGTHYIRYLIGHHSFTDYLKGIWTGIAVPHISETQIRAFKILLPPVPVQERIIEVLGAYDDLIENKTRRIKILEDMAQMIYREWFVNFRFPGHEKVRMVESELGPTPERWRVGRLDEALVLQRGFDLPTSQRNLGLIPIIAATGLNGSHNEARVKAPGVVTGRSGSLGTVMLVWEDFWPLNTTLWVKEFRQSNPIHAYFTLEALDLKGFNSGAAVPTLNRNDIHGLPTVPPDRETLDAFNECVLPLFALKRNLEAKNSNLRTTRDLLLPKLISGEIPAQAADEATPEITEEVALHA